MNFFAGGLTPYGLQEVGGPSGSYATLTAGKLTQSENPQPNIIDIRYFAPSSIVNGTRDGSVDYPFANMQDCIDYFGDPVDQADFNRQVFIICLDRPTLTEAPVFSTRRYSVYFLGGTFTGNWTLNIDNALRFSSSFSPGIDIYSATRPLGTQIIGNLTYTLNGTAVNNISGRLTNVLWTGNCTIADGVNGGSSVTSGTASQITLSGAAFTGTFLGRNTGVGGQNSSINGNVEIQTVLSSTNFTLSGTSIQLFGTATTTRNIFGLSLAAAGGVTWTNTNVGPRWNADAYTWQQLFLKTTGSYTNAFVPQNNLGALTAADNTNLATELAAFPLTLAVINNMRTRQAEIEARLQTLEIIP